MERDSDFAVVPHSVSGQLQFCLWSSNVFLGAYVCEVYMWEINIPLLALGMKGLDCGAGVPCIWTCRMVVCNWNTHINIRNAPAWQSPFLPYVCCFPTRLNQLQMVQSLILSLLLPVISGSEANKHPDITEFEFMGSNAARHHVDDVATIEQRAIQGNGTVEQFLLLL